MSQHRTDQAASEEESLPIFISYSHKDRAFVDALAKNLVAERHHVWMDRWELNLGDSLTQKIQDALTDSSAILVVLSKNSVESEWCKRELSAGLIRELEERKTFVMPCVIDDCQIPLFLRDKLHADFSINPDEAIRLVHRSLARISNPFQSRAETPKFHTDWSVDWTREENIEVIRFTFVDHGHDWPYVILSQCTIMCNESAGLAFAAAQAEESTHEFIREVLAIIVAGLEKNPLSEKIEDAFERFVVWSVEGKNNHRFDVLFTYRRMGTDNGMDTIVHLDNNLRIALQHMTEVGFRPPTKDDA